MQRMCGASARIGFLVFVATFASEWSTACGDLIRSSPGRTFPDIAGDIAGAQTYTYDPTTQTGMFEFVNAPHLISLGPSVQDMFHMLPDQDGTLSQSLQLKLDRFGRLVDSPMNRFQIRGSVLIGDRVYHGLLLEGRPTDFGAETQETKTTKNKSPEVFDLNMKITGGELAKKFGPEAYLRIVPQRASTFNGQFTADFSSARPLTNLRANRRRLPASVPEPTAIVTFLTFGGGLLVYRVRRHLKRTARRRGRF
jgi:hypothetical protein